jgi:hypothetical protein
LYPKNFFDFLNQNIFLFIMFISAVVFYLFTFFNERKQMFTLDHILKEKRIITLTLFLLSSVFFVAIANISNRFSDFFLFFAWIFIALVFNEVFSFITFNKPMFKKAIKCAGLICLTYLFLNNLLQLNQMFGNSGSRPEAFRGVGTYLSNNLKKGDIVFNVGWSWFPQLYYYAPDQNYIIGLEPKLTYLYDSKIYWLWSNVGNGYVCEKEKCPELDTEQNSSFRTKDLFSKWTKEEGDKIAETIVNDFKSHYIVSSNNYSYLNSVLNNNNHFRKILNSNNSYFIYKILD